MNFGKFRFQQVKSRKKIPFTNFYYEVPQETQIFGKSPHW